MKSFSDRYSEWKKDRAARILTQLEVKNEQRVREIAEGSGVSKFAVVWLVADLLDYRYIEKHRVEAGDPPTFSITADGKAYLLRYGHKSPTGLFQ